MGKITTSLKIDEEVYKKFKKKCIDKDLEFSEGIGVALMEWTK